MDDKLGNIGSLQLSTEVTEKDLAEAWEDECGVKYSKDRKRLLKAPDNIKQYEICKGTIVICDRAFIGCESLQRINIPSSVTSIGNSAFRWCVSLQSIDIPSSVVSIGDGVFAGCDIELKLNSQLFSSDGICLFDTRKYSIIGCHKTSIEVYAIPSSVTSIGVGAFCWCEALQGVAIPSSVTSIGVGAFRYCFALQRISIPSSVTSIGNEAFEGCVALQSINIPEGSQSKFEKLLPEHVHILLIESGPGESPSDPPVKPTSDSKKKGCLFYARHIIIPFLLLFIGGRIAAFILQQLCPYRIVLSIIPVVYLWISNGYIYFSLKKLLGKNSKIAHSRYLFVKATVFFLLIFTCIVMSNNNKILVIILFYVALAIMIIDGILSQTAPNND